MNKEDNIAITSKGFVGMECLMIAVLIGIQVKNFWWGVAAFFALLCIFFIPVLGGILSILCCVFESIIVCHIAMQFFSASAAGIITFCAFYLFVVMHRKFGVISEERVFGYSLLISESIILSVLMGDWLKSIPIALALFAVLLIMMFVPILRGMELVILAIGTSCIVFFTAQNFMDLKYAIIISILVLAYAGYNHWSAYLAIVYRVNIRRNDVPAVTDVVDDKREPEEQCRVQVPTVKDKEEKYYEQAYYKITHLNYSDMLHDDGRYGEYMIYEKLKDFEKLGGRFLFNCYIDRGNNQTTEIDVLLICRSGIFVFESKNYNGWILGKEQEMNWTQCLPAGKGKGNSVKVKFYNPVKQNETHINYLKNYVGNNIPIFSIIVFSDKCTLKDVKVNDGNGYVIQLKQIIATIYQCIEQTGTALSENEISDLYNKLYPLTQVSQEVKQKHIQDIENYKDAPDMNDKEIERVQMLLCPRCGSSLVLRTIKRGKDIGGVFYGCSAFPDCRYTREITESEIKANAQDSVLFDNRIK